jgi:hypothetical protein
LSGTKLKHWNLVRHILNVIQRSSSLYGYI